MESISVGERQELELLRQRVRASRRATSAPLLVFGVAMLAFACYEGLVRYAFVPRPLFWPMCSLVSLLVLAGVDRVRRRAGVGAGRLSYGKATSVLVGVLLAGNLLWIFPFVGMLLWPGTVLTVLALRQRNHPLARRAGIIGGVMIVGWFLSGLVTAEWFNPVLRGGCGAAMLVLGLAAWVRERAAE
jgi:hypothetical protein